MGGRGGGEEKRDIGSSRGMGEAEEEGAVQESEEDEEGGGGPPRSKGGLESVRARGNATPQEEGMKLTDFTSKRAHLLLQGVYGELPNHNNGSHLDGGVLYYAV